MVATEGKGQQAVPTGEVPLPLTLKKVGGPLGRFLRDSDE